MVLPILKRILTNKNVAELSLTYFDKRFIALTALCRGDMLKPKTLIDPEVIKAKWDRKKTKFLREIKLIQLQGRKYKPVDELLLAPKVRKEMSGRIRKNPEMTEDEADRRYRILRDYSNYINRMKNRQNWTILRMVKTQRAALDELKAESEDLFQAATARLSNLDIVCRGPVESPPLIDYQPFEGAYTDVTKNWDRGSTAAEFIVEKKAKGPKKITAAERAELENAKLLKQVKQLQDPKLMKLLESTPKRK